MDQQEEVLTVSKEDNSMSLKVQVDITPELVDVVARKAIRTFAMYTTIRAVSYVFVNRMLKRG